jgi:hypothetical protein
MSIQQNFPAITPSLSLNFARSKKLDPRITFTRTSSATRINETGLLEVVPANSPRFDHSYDPISGSVKSLGLLIEEQRTNLLVRSEEFNDAAWAKVNSIISENTIAAPNGTVTADKFIANTTNATHRVRPPSVSYTSGSVYTFSVYARAAEYSKVVITTSNLISGEGEAEYTLSGGGVADNYGLNAVSISAVGDGWYRLSCTVTAASTSTSADAIRILLDNGSGVTFAGDNTSGLFLWGAQLEQGSFPTSYIPTTNSTVTRTADLARIEGKVFQDFFNPSEGTTIIQIQNYNISNTSTSLLSYSGTTVPNNSMNYFRQLDAQPVGQIIFNGTLPMNIGLGPVWTDSSLQKHAFFYQKDNSGIANRSLVSLDTSVDIPVVERMIIGSTVQANNKFTLSQLTYYPKRLSNQQLINLTK